VKGKTENWQLDRYRKPMLEKFCGSIPLCTDLYITVVGSLKVLLLMIF
jgi:hypothetical protein